MTVLAARPWSFLMQFRKMKNEERAFARVASCRDITYKGADWLLEPSVLDSPRTEISPKTVPDFATDGAMRGWRMRKSILVSDYRS